MVFGVYWSGKLWVAGGTGTNCLAYSYDGINWEASSGGNSIFTSCNGLGWNGYLWIAGGQGTNTLAYSYDGINWVSSANGNTILTDGCWEITTNGKIWVAGGRGSGTHRLAYSYDGINWTGSSSGSNILTISCFGLYWNGQLFVAGGNGTNRLAYSYDGINWVVSTSGSSLISSGSPPEYYIVYSNLQTIDIEQPIIAVGNDLNNKDSILYSYNGIKWTSLGRILLNEARCAKWNGKIWLVGGTNSSTENTIIYSRDGINWKGVGQTPFITVKSIEWNGNMWVAVGAEASSNTIAISYDGISWTTEGINRGDLTSGDIVKWNGEKFLIGGSAGGSRSIVYSTDGFNWSPSDNAGTLLNIEISDIGYFHGTWVAVGQGDSNGIITSTDGITWTGRGDSAIGLGKSVDSDGKYIVVSGAYDTNVYYAYSSDLGVTWTQRTDSGKFNQSSNTIESMRWVKDKWVFGGNGLSNRIYYAYDIDVREVRCRTTQELSVTPNGTGVGKTLTSNANPFVTIGSQISNFDDQTLVLNDEVLVLQQTNEVDNGVYKVTNTGTAGVEPWVLTRVDYYDDNNDINTFQRFKLTSGSKHANKFFVSKQFNAQIDTDPITFTSSDSGIYFAETHTTNLYPYDFGYNSNISSAPIPDNVIPLSETDIHKKIQVNTGDYFDINCTNLSLRM